MTEARKSWVVPGVLVVLILALLGTAGVLHARQGEDVDPGMLVAARTQAKNFVSLDHRTAEKDADKVLALATGSFKKEYSAAKEQLVAGIVAKKITTVGSIPKNGSAIESASGDKGQVLVTVDVTRKIGTNTDSIRYRSRLTMTKVDGRWLVSGIDEVP